MSIDVIDVGADETERVLDGHQPRGLVPGVSRAVAKWIDHRTRTIHRVVQRGGNATERVRGRRRLRKGVVAVGGSLAKRVNQRRYSPSRIESDRGAVR